VNRVEHNYLVRNGGQAMITELRLWIVDASETVVSTRAGGEIALAPGDPPVALGIQVPPSLPEGELTLWTEWRDVDGLHSEPTDIHPATSLLRVGLASRRRTRAASSPWAPHANAVLVIDPLGQSAVGRVVPRDAALLAAQLCPSLGGHRSRPHLPHAAAAAIERATPRMPIALGEPKEADRRDPKHHRKSCQVAEQNPYRQRDNDDDDRSDDPRPPTHHSSS
jgi:hypothetical protein